MSTASVHIQNAELILADISERSVVMEKLANSRVGICEKIRNSIESEMLVLESASSILNRTNRPSKIFAVERVPCGTDNGIPKKCGTDRSVDYEVRFENLMRYTQCGMSSVTAYPFFDQTNPFLVSTCGGTSGKFVSFGPFLAIPESGWINAKVHIWPCPVSDMSMPEDLFALDVYSVSAGGVLKSRSVILTIAQL